MEKELTPRKQVCFRRAAWGPEPGAGELAGTRPLPLWLSPPGWLSCYRTAFSASWGTIGKRILALALCNPLNGSGLGVVGTSNGGGLGEAGGGQERWAGAREAEPVI